MNSNVILGLNYIVLHLYLVDFQIPVKTALLF